MEQGVRSAVDNLCMMCCGVLFAQDKHGGVIH